MQAIYIAIVYISLLVLGCAAPFAFSLGYVWVDAFSPQNIAPELGQIPLAMIMGAAAFGSYLLMDRASPPGFTLTTCLTLMMAVWVTLTSTWAVAPAMAWSKWNWAFKTILFSAFIPFVFRSRVQIEAFLYVYLAGIAAQIMPVGIKTLLSGGGYGLRLGLTADTGLGETSTLSAVAIMAIPLLLYWIKHSILGPPLLVRKLFCGAYMCLCIATAVGTFARTGLIAISVLGAMMWLQSRHKIRTAIVIAILAAAASPLASDAWMNRMSTLENYQAEDSALGRILVWKWTLDFAAANPLGGGFNSYVVNRIAFPPPPGQSKPTYVVGKAFHNIYIEVLGEHGWIGLGIYVCLILVSVAKLLQMMRRCQGPPDLQWCHDLSRALLTGLLILATAGCFIGIAFQPMLWYLFASTTCLSSHMRRVMQQKAAAIADGPEERLARVQYSASRRLV
jgi:putative inorganic carbon (hco3(-)) transporter